MFYSFPMAFKDFRGIFQSAGQNLYVRGRPYEQSANTLSIVPDAQPTVTFTPGLHTNHLQPG
jgi:hypothetical protein